MSGTPLRLPLLEFLYLQFLEDQDAAAFMRKLDFAPSNRAFDSAFARD